MQEYVEKISELVKEGKTDDEIVELLEKEDNFDKFSEYINGLHEKEVQESLKRVNHSEEEEQENFREVINNPTAAQYIADKVEYFSEKGKSDHEIIEEFNREEEIEDLEKLREKEVKKLLKRVDHSDEEDDKDFENEIDNLAAVQEFVDDPEKIVDNGRSEVKIGATSKEKDNLNELVKLVRKLHEQEIQEANKQVDHLKTDEIVEIEEEIRMPNGIETEEQELNTRNQ